MSGAACCPRCGGDTYDNRAENDARLARGEKLRPDFKCRRRECDGIVWRSSPKKAAATPPAGKQAVTLGAPIPGLDDAVPPAPPPTPAPAAEKLTVCYLSTLDFVIASVKPRYERAGVPMDAAAVSAVTAQLFIARCRNER